MTTPVLRLGPILETDVKRRFCKRPEIRGGFPVGPCWLFLLGLAGLLDGRFLECVGASMGPDRPVSTLIPELDGTRHELLATGSAVSLDTGPF